MHQLLAPCSVPIERTTILTQRELTKTKGGFANENSLLKLLYAGILKASERWTHPIQNWNLTLSQLTIHFPGRLDGHISL